MHTEASILQLGSVIRKGDKPTSLYRNTPTGMQSWYTVTEKVLLSMVKNLKESLTTVLGKHLKIYTYHKI